MGAIQYAIKKIMASLEAFIRFLLYGNFWIALGALAMSMQSSYLFSQEIKLERLHIFIFSATLFLYATHRLVALKRLKDGEAWQERFFYISKAQRMIYLYAGFALVITLILFIDLPLPTQLALLIPGLISLAYVFPVLKGKKRIRDIHYIKIFLIAITWAWISVVLPAMLIPQIDQSTVVLMFLERLLFVFGITLPFDIRDLLLDEQQSVKTLPAILGTKKTQWVAAGVFFLMLLFSGGLLYIGVYNLKVFIAILLSSLIAYLLVINAHPNRPDYYFTGFLDGTMVLQFILVVAFNVG